MTSFKDIYQTTIRDRDTKMPFGKYKGLPIHEVMANDPDYLVFMQQNGALDVHSDLWDEMREMYIAECDRYLQP